MSVGVTNLVCLDATAETTYATAQTTPDKRWPMRGTRPRLEVNTATDNNSMTGVYEEGRETIVTKKWMTASYDFDLRLDALAFWAKAVLGTCNTTGAGPYTHAITLLQGDAPSYTLYWKDANTTNAKLEQFTGVKAKKLSIKGTGGGKCTMSTDLMGSGVHAETTTTAPSQNVDTPLAFAQISAFTIGGTDYKAKLLEFSLDLENSFDDGNEFVAGSYTLPKLERTGFKVSGALKIQWDENALTGLLADIEAQTSRAIVFTITNGTYSATITVHKAFMTGNPDAARNKQTLSINFNGMYDDSATKAITVSVVNNTSAYT